ncbi:MAG: HlyD family efflux transporter periplasmic adaptor subunit [Dehalococcoidia bacterium]
MKPWQMGGLAALLLVVVVGIYGASSLFGGSDSPESADGPSLVTPQEQPKTREVPVTGRLSFPIQEELTFETNGEVGEIPVASGNRVTKSQVLARLDDTTISTLSQVLAKARSDLDAAEDALDEAQEAFVNTPLEQARFEEKIAKARVALEDAEEALDDFQRDQEQELAKARKTKAEAEVAVDDAEEALRNFERDHQQTLAKALTAKAAAEIALDNAQEKLADFERDESQELAKARKAEAVAEVALDVAQDKLLDFIIDYDEELATAQKRVADAETALEVAEDALTDFKRNPTADIREEENIDVEILRRLEASVAVAQSELNQANKELARIDGGPDSLKRQDLETAVELARATLVQAQADVAELSQGLDLLELQKREAAIQAAQATLAQATEDLAEEREGPDPLKQKALEAALELAQTKLVQAIIDLEEELEGPDPEQLAVREQDVAKKEEELTELIDGPDPFDVALREAEVVSARARVEDALEDLEGTTIKAPFDGVISLVNVEVDDLVDKESRVIEIIDPRRVELDGRIDAGDREFVSLGDRAEVDLASLPGQKLPGTVTWLSDQPSTERGVVSYTLRISIELPQGVEAPVELSAVSGVVLHQ